MKHLAFTPIICLSLITLSIIACSKNSITNHSIAGKWEQRKITGGIGGTVTYEPGSGVRLIFEKDSTWSMERLITNGLFTLGGNYDIKGSAKTGDWLLRLHSVTERGPAISDDSVRLSPTELIFLPAAGCCDMQTTFYQRVQ